MEHLKDTILKKIETKSIEKIPRWQFVLHGIFGIISGVLLFIITIFIVQLVLLVIQEYNVSHLIGIIPSRYGFFQAVSFWTILIIGIALSIGFYRWIRNHGHFYRYKNFYTIIVSFALIVGSVVAIRSFDTSMQFARIGEHPIPGIHQLDQAARPPRPTGLLSGVVVINNESLLAIKTRDGKIFYVKIPLFEQLENDFDTGDRVTVFGIIYNDQIDAKRIVKQ